jgi:uncharacterized protein (DUF433 family)
MRDHPLRARSLSAARNARILPGVSLLHRITVDPEICHGKPVIRGLRYPVESMLEYMAGGDSVDDILAEFPDLERDDLLACLEFAATAVKLKSSRVPTAA